MKALILKNIKNLETFSKKLNKTRKMINIIKDRKKDLKKDQFLQLGSIQLLVLIEIKILEIETEIINLSKI